MPDHVDVDIDDDGIVPDRHGDVDEQFDFGEEVVDDDGHDDDQSDDDEQVEAVEQPLAKRPAIPTRHQASGFQESWKENRRWLKWTGEDK